MSIDPEDAAKMLRQMEILRRVTDLVRQADNLILLELRNPSELDQLRGELLDCMRMSTGKLQEIRKRAEKAGIL